MPSFRNSFGSPMAHFLKALNLLMVTMMTLTFLSAIGYDFLDIDHIRLAIPSFLLVIFVQAFVMFFFIGCYRLIENVFLSLSQESSLDELFEVPPQDLTPYLRKTKTLYYQAKVAKRQTTAWAVLMLLLGMIAFLLGGAYDTGLVSIYAHAGVVYGFMIVMYIGVWRQWIYLTKAHQNLRVLKALFEIPDAQM
jgi:hypothetical protein